MKIKLREIYLQQSKLDLEIQKNHKTSYKETRNKRYLAFLVELGELANATRCFKFWSFKNSEEKARLIDEFADGLHFILSIGLDHQYVLDNLEFDDNINLDLSSTFLETYNYFSVFLKNDTLENYKNAFIKFLSIAIKLNFSLDDIINGYLKKLSVNYQRQETNY